MSIKVHRVVAKMTRVCKKIYIGLSLHEQGVVTPVTYKSL